jgi:galactokinase
VTDPDAVAKAFAASIGREPAGVWAAPGRVNLIGEHTDYNEGFVLPLGLPQRVLAAAAPTADSKSTVRSAQQSGSVHTFAASSVEAGEVEGWAAYLAGVFWALRTAGHPVPELDVFLDGDVPLGAGLSSSAAVECAVAVAVNDLAALDLDATALALQARRAENLFVGAPTGVMDQMAAMHARQGHLLFLDTRSLAVEHVPFDLQSHGLALLVVDTRAPHALVDSEYATRRATCEAAARMLNVTALRDIAPTDLSVALPALPDDVSRRRVRHVVTENARVLEVVAILRSGADPHDIGPLLTASHVSLRDDFEVTVPQLDVAVDAALTAGASGARMTGGGFGGCIIALTERTETDHVVAGVVDAFADAGFDPPASFVVAPSDGARRLR